MEKTNETKRKDTNLMSFDPIVLLQDVLRRWLVIILAALIVGVGAYIVTDASYSPVYQTNTVFVVTTKGSSTSVFSNLTSTTNVATLFTDLLNSSIMKKTVMEEMGVSSLDATISTAAIPNTNLISMTVASSNPRTAFLTARTLIETHEALTYTIVDGIVMEVLQQPTVSVVPINSANSLTWMKRATLLAALAAAILLAVYSASRNVVRSSSEAREKLECTCLGEIPHEEKNKTVTSRLRHKKSSILITSPVTGFAYVEAIRKLRHRIERHADGKKVIMVTSLLENEGKSTVAANLALSLSQKHGRVLLIDCDLRKPACHNILEHKIFTSGIKEVLQGKANLSDAIIRHQNTRLYLLLARKVNQNSSDLLTNERMRILLDWARKNFDYIILDLPPMAAAADAEAMTALADAAVMVVRQNVASVPALNKALATLDNHQAELLGCVLNNFVSSRFSRNGYGYGYGYGYGGYHKHNYYGNYHSQK